MLSKSQNKWSDYVHKLSYYPTDSELLWVGQPEFELFGNLGHEVVFQETLAVTREILIDVTDTCNFNTATGIQRVVRNLISELEAIDAKFRLVAWTKDEARLRTLSNDEILVATGRDISLGHHPKEGLSDPDEYQWIDPSKCLIVVPELAGQQGRIKRIVSLSRNSSNKFVCIAFDAVPVLLPDTAAEGMPGAFTFQIQLWENAQAIFCISEATKQEVTSLLSGMKSRNLTLPTTVSCALPVLVDNQENIKKNVSPVPKFLVVGTHEPRKNHLRILIAAEALWEDGFNFELHFIGSSGWRSDDFWEKYHLLKAKGYRLSEDDKASDEKLTSSYLDSTCLLFPSIHEGFGLPIAEAVHYRLPVITSNVGSMKDLAETFRLQMIDPYNVQQIIDAMQKVVESGIELQSFEDLQQEYPKTWAEYAAKIWLLINEENNKLEV